VVAYQTGPQGIPPPGYNAPGYRPYYDPNTYFSPYAPRLLSSGSKGASGVCIGNAGMILFICLVGLSIFYNLIGGLWM
jgi:hypothetical protein